MKIAITGGTGFVGRHLGRELAAHGHEVVLIARGVDQRDLASRTLPGTRFVAASTDDQARLEEAFAGCDAVAHCAGINREKGDQTYERVHVRGTQAVVDAARNADVRKVVLVSFLRARPDCGLPYHESKWQAEEIVRGSGLDYTVVKEGITYGLGDHMLDHLNWAMRTLPVFAFVGLKEKPIRPIAVEDLVRILVAALVDGQLSRRTVAVVGPEEMTLSEAVRRVSRAIGKRPLIWMRLPVWFHQMLAVVWEALMEVPLASRAQVRMLAEGLAEPAPPTEPVPDDLAPRLLMTQERILQGIPPEPRKT